MITEGMQLKRQFINAIVSMVVCITSLSGAAFAHEKARHSTLVDHSPSDETNVAINPDKDQVRTDGGRDFLRRINNDSPLPLDQGGQWSEPVEWPVLAVHANLLATGKVLAWDATPDDFDEDPHTTDNYTTRVTLWDPVTNSHTETNNDTDTDLFCAGSSHTWDGRVLFAGGDSETEGRNGPLSNANLYDPWTNTWERADNMSAARWYSSVAALPNGELLTMGGSYSPQPLGEVYQLSQNWRDLDLNTPYSLSGDYQWIQSGPDGSVLYFGPHDLLSTIHTEGVGRWEVNTVRDGLGYRGYGSYAMYDTGKILVAGGGDSSDSSIIVDAVSKQSSGTGSLNHGRRQHNLTILADGSVLATGGNHSGSDLVDLFTGVFTPEIWDPQTGQWSLANDMQVDRQYHSIALLLPDGRVLSAGGGYCGLCSQLNYHEQNAEVFSPPYLFNANGQLAERPQIISAPEEVNYGTSFSVDLNSTNAIDKVHFIKLGSVTHSENQDQRLVPASFEQQGSELIVNSPSQRNTAPPGHYMLFVVEDGVPSESKIIKVGQPLLKLNTLAHNSIRANERQVFAFEPLAGQSLLSVNLETISGNPDLVVKIGSPADAFEPDSSMDCASRNTGGSNENCSVNLNGRDTVYISVLGTTSASYNLIVGTDDIGPEFIFPENIITVKPTNSTISNQLIPSVPTNLRGEVYSSRSAEIFWNASIDNDFIQGYDVFRNGVLLESFDARSSYQSDLQPNTIYTYTVRAFDGDGNTSALTSSITLQTPNDLGILTRTPVQPSTATVPPVIQGPVIVPTSTSNSAPTVPPNLRGEIYSSNSGEIFWDASTDETAVIGYEVRRNGEVIARFDARSAYQNDLEPNTSYTYTVSAYDADDNSSALTENLTLQTPNQFGVVTQTPTTTPTNPVVVTPVVPTTPSGTAPTAPPNLTGLVYSSSSAEIFWDASTDDQSVAGYEVMRNGEVIERFDARSAYQTDLQAGTEYTYTVLAFDNEGNRSSLSNTITLVTPGGTGPVAVGPTTPQTPTTVPNQNLTLALIDATADERIAEHINLSDGDRIDIGSLGTQQFNVEAVIDGIDDVAEVQFDFDGVSRFRTERFVPYALFGDRRRVDFIGMPISEGSHTLTVRVYVGTDVVERRSITFYFDN